MFVLSSVSVLVTYSLLIVVKSNITTALFALVLLFVIHACVFQNISS